MKSSLNDIAPWALLATVANAAAASVPGPNATPHQFPVIYSTYTSFSYPPFTYPPVPEPTASTTTPDVEARADDSGWNLVVFNSAGFDLTMSYQSNPGAPGPTLGGQPGTLPTASATQVAWPSGWAGRVDFGLAGANIDPRGSLIEGSYMNGQIDVDVSYVNGFSVPIMCYGPNNLWISGCPFNLFDNGNTCENWSENGDVCLNEAGIQNTHNGCGPAPKFFSDCQGLAYTFPEDNRANSDNEVPVGDLILCCVDDVVGTANNCPSPNSANPSLGYGQSDPQCSGIPAQTSKRDSEKRVREPETPVDIAEGHWFYNHTFFDSVQTWRRENGHAPLVIPDNIFKK